MTLDNNTYDSAGRLTRSWADEGAADRVTETWYTKLDQALETRRYLDASGTLSERTWSRTTADAAGNETDRCTWAANPNDWCLRADDPAWASARPVPIARSSSVYDARNQRVSLFVPGEGETTYDPTADYQVQGVFLPLGTGTRERQTIHAYDSRDRLVTITVYECTAKERPFCSGTEIASSSVTDTYEYDDAGNRTSVIEDNGSGPVTRYYCYDARNQLTSVSTSSATCASGVVETYAYDDAGNRTSAPGRTFTYDDRDQEREVSEPDPSDSGRRAVRAVDRAQLPSVRALHHRPFETVAESGEQRSDHAARDTWNMSHSRKSAAQLLAELATDPVWVEARAEDDAKRAAEGAELAAEEEPILAELRQVGLDVPSTWSLIEEHRDAMHPGVLPILLDHIARPYHPAIREGMARALGAPVARPIWRTLADLYVAEDNDQVKQGLACAVAETVTDDTLDELLALIADPRNGLTRNLLLLAKMPARAATALEGLAADPGLRQELPRLLKRLRRSRKAPIGGPPSPLDPAFEEASSGFDLETVPAFLSILVRLGFGFERSHAKAVRAMVDTLNVGDERELRFDLASGGGGGTLVVRAFLDDPHAVDLYFFGSPAHAAKIGAAMERLGDQGTGP